MKTPSTSRTVCYDLDSGPLELDISLDTRAKVSAVATALFNRERWSLEAITQNAIRDILGTGSITTIASELRRWKQETSALLRDADVPAPVLEASLALWSAARDAAAQELAQQHQAIDKERADMQAAIDEANDVLETEKANASLLRESLATTEETLRGVKAELATEKDALKIERDLISAERKEHASRMAALEAALASEQKDNHALQAKLDRQAEAHADAIKQLEDRYKHDVDSWIKRYDNERLAKEKTNKSMHELRDQANKKIEQVRSEASEKLASIEREAASKMSEAQVEIRELSTLLSIEKATKTELVKQVRAGRDETKVMEAAKEDLWYQLADLKAEITILVTENNRLNEQLAAFSETEKQPQKGKPS